MYGADVVGRVRNGETPPFRPRVPAGSSVEAVDSRLVDLMQQCWLEDPAHRPTVAAVLTRFTDITQIQSVSYPSVSSPPVRTPDKDVMNLFQFVIK